MKKKELRALYKEKRNDLSELEIEKLQTNIYNQIYQLDFSSVKNIHIFLSIQKHKELNTYPIIKYLQRLGKSIIISKSNFSDSTLTHFIFDNNTVLKENKYGIPEPIQAEAIAVEEIDLVFVPLLISDEHNYRVGYGKGFYDRFLQNCRSDIQTIGLNFFKPITHISDINEFDIPLQRIIYPT